MLERSAGHSLSTEPSVVRHTDGPSATNTVKKVKLALGKAKRCDIEKPPLSRRSATPRYQI
jgi:hypothetical protein